jgi:GTPase Era involved in 16S rRNA processing
MESMLGTDTARPADDLIVLDHRSFDELYNRYRSTITDVAEQQRIANELIREIAVHSVGEELVSPSFKLFISFT